MRNPLSEVFRADEGKLPGIASSRKIFSGRISFYHLQVKGRMYGQL